MTPFRILRIQPATNYERVTITAARHSDDWYLDNYGLQDDPSRSERRRDKLPRASFPWAPYKVQPFVGDSMFPREEWGFAIQVAAAEDGTYSNLLCTGRLPVNDFSATLQPPQVGRQGTMAAGGSLLGGGWTYFFAVCGVDSDGKLTEPSEVCACMSYAAGVYTATIPVASWDAATVGYQVFGGLSPTTLTWQATGSGTPATIDIAAFLDITYGVPDSEFDGIEIAIKREIHGGIWGAACTAVESRAITIPGCGLDPAFPSGGGVGLDYGGRILSLIAKADGSAVPIYNVLIDSNNENVLYVDASCADPVDVGIAEGDVFVLRSSMCSIADLTVTDTMWQNPLSNTGLGLAVNAEKGNILRVISGTGCGYRYNIASNDETSITIADPWIQTPDETSVFSVEEANWLPDSAELVELNNSNPIAEVTVTVPVRNFAGSTLFVMGFTRDGSRNMPPEQLNPFREVYISQNVADSLDLGLDGFEDYDGTIM